MILSVTTWTIIVVYYTHQKSVNKHGRALSVPPEQAERCPETSKRSRSLSLARNPEGKIDIYTTTCVICGQVKYLEVQTNLEYVNLEGLNIS